MKKNELFDNKVNQMTSEQADQVITTDRASREFFDSLQTNVSQSGRVIFVKRILSFILVICAFFIQSLSCPAIGSQIPGSGSTSIIGDPPTPGNK